MISKREGSSKGTEKIKSPSGKEVET